MEYGTEMTEETLSLAIKNNVILVGTDFTEEA